MNYNYIENLVRQSKDGDICSKEKLMQEFRPFIINLSKRTFIHGYEFEDIMNECYRILLKCIALYKMENHRFVAYATNGIKNSINDLIRKSLKNDSVSGSSTVTIDSYIENTCRDNKPDIEDILCSQYDYDCLKYALSSLNEEEQELIYSIYFTNKTLKAYAAEKNISYSYAFKKKKNILNKLLIYINSKMSLDNTSKTSVC